MLILLPVLVAIVGGIVYVVTTNPKVSELGRIAFAFGLLVALLTSGEKVIALFK